MGPGSMRRWHSEARDTMHRFKINSSLPEKSNRDPISGLRPVERELVVQSIIDWRDRTRSHYKKCRSEDPCISRAPSTSRFSAEFLPLERGHVRERPHVVEAVLVNRKMTKT